ncbi:hypothetical protein [Planococcus lenghuensis]|uniref:DUF1797 family protein n=1 Tax=Planococcus lenghuensis TaxID=2213202 RepID=A0A1Q2KVK6_9BACL|nr:hypothetical protein [Planococcus lenghuensis]AQQ52173.1 hypothetical protein B0X71_02960 [Planococcus lenghuensis]
MNLEHIQETLKTVQYYHNVNIVQTFEKEDGTSIRVKCIENTRTLEVSYSASETIERYETIEEAAVAIEQYLNLEITT